MRIQITIDCDNAAFDVDPMNEAQHIIADAIVKLKYIPVGGAENLYDSNGNRVGEVRVSDFWA